MNKKKLKQEYQAPQAEAIEARVERGFQVSGSSEPENGTEEFTPGQEYSID